MLALPRSTRSPRTGNISLAPLNVSTSVAPGDGTNSTPTNSNATVLAELRQNDGQKELPYWMIKDAEDLHNYYLTIKIPDIYKATTKSICHAGATSIDLSKLSKNFYEFGMHMSTLDDDNVIGTLLLDMARQRLAGLFNACNYTEGDGRKEQNFENHEKKLLEVGCENFSNFHSWLIRDTSAQRSKGQKRKRSVMEA